MLYGFEWPFEKRLCFNHSGLVGYKTLVENRGRLKKKACIRSHGGVKNNCFILNHTVYIEKEYFIICPLSIGLTTTYKKIKYVIKQSNDIQ